MSLTVTETKVKLAADAADAHEYPQGCPGAWISVTRRPGRPYLDITAGPYPWQASCEEAAAFAAAVAALANR